MKRREFITSAGRRGGAPLAPLRAAAQPKVIRRVGFLGGVNILSPSSESYRAFLAQMDELGFRAGRNVIIEYKALADPRGPAGSVADLLRSKPDVIVVTGPEIALQAVLAQSKTHAGGVPGDAIRSGRTEARRQPGQAGRQRHRRFRAPVGDRPKADRAADRGAAGTASASPWPGTTTPPT